MNPIVLVAESDSELRELYEMYLSECGYDVETAADGAECVEKLQSVRPNVVLLDLELDWDGDAGMLAWLRDEAPSLGVPVVLTTSSDYSLELTMAMQPPVYCMLGKPFALPALLESLCIAMPKGGREEVLVRPVSMSGYPPRSVGD